MANNISRHTSQPSIAQDRVSGIDRSSSTQNNSVYCCINSATKIGVCNPSPKTVTGFKPSGSISSCSPKSSK